jgi:hypothetical protein
MSAKPKKKKLKTTQLTLEYLRLRGWKCKVVEKFNTFSHKYNDVWGADILAVKDGMPYPMLVQTTSAANIAARQKKIEKIEEARIWLQHSAFMVQGWYPDGIRSIVRFAFFDANTSDFTWEDHSPSPAKLTVARKSSSRTISLASGITQGIESVSLSPVATGHKAPRKAPRFKWNDQKSTRGVNASREAETKGCTAGAASTADATRCS